MLGSVIRTRPGRQFVQFMRSGAGKKIVIGTASDRDSDYLCHRHAPCLAIIEVSMRRRYRALQGPRGWT